MKRIMVFVSALAFTAQLNAHGGRVDDNGGHYNRKTNEYHCHREPCRTIHKKTGQAFKEAIREGRQVSALYNRKDWPHWSDIDKNCMNTRHEILKDQAERGSVKYSPDGCYVSRGKWYGPYSGKIYTRASDLDVDHVIPLKWANTNGGALWTRKQKEAFANDPDNLLAVDDGLNQQKGAKGPAEWMPPNSTYTCTYLTKWQTVLHKYPDLELSHHERRFIERKQQSCQ